MPAADACTAPQMPSVSPTCPRGADAIAAVNVQWANSPAPAPMPNTPAANSAGICSGAAKITAANAHNPAAAANPASR